MNQHGPTALLALTLSTAGDSTGVKVEPTNDGNSTATKKEKKVKVKKEPNDETVTANAITRALKIALKEKGLAGLPGLPASCGVSAAVTALNELMGHLPITKGKRFKPMDAPKFREQFLTCTPGWRADAPKFREQFLTCTPGWRADANSPASAGHSQLIHWHSAADETAAAAANLVHIDE